MAKPTVTLLPVSIESIGTSSGTAAPTSTIYPSANRAIFIPFNLDTTTKIVKMFVMNGGTVSGSIDVGIYDGGGIKLSSIGTGVSQTGTNALQTFDITDVVLFPGRYFMAVALDNNSGFLFRKTAGNLQVFRTYGLFQMASAYPLPATATFATISSNYLPMVGATVRSVV